MDKNSALKKLKDFELLNRIKHIDLVDILTENDFIKLNAEVSWLEASFILSVPIVSSVAFLTLSVFLRK